VMLFMDQKVRVGRNRRRDSRLVHTLSEYTRSHGGKTPTVVEAQLL